jgi:hypothetical protein
VESATISRTAAGARAVAGVLRRDQAPAGLEAVELDLRDVGSIVYRGTTAT